MIFKGINKQTVEFRITNYEFPKITNCYYDSNWLLISLKVKSDCGNWQTTDPSLFTRDVADIIDWFNKLSKNEKVEFETLDFMEPNLEFELIKNETDLKIVRMKFDLESRPQNANDEKDYFVDCEMNNIELNRVADELRKELEPYPERAIG